MMKRVVNFSHECQFLDPGVVHVAHCHTVMAYWGTHIFYDQEMIRKAALVINVSLVVYTTLSQVHSTFGTDFQWSNPL